MMARVRGGTLLIDEIADIDDEVQARIVRMMDTPGDHVPRFMATSQTDLTEAMESGRVRQDLYYRLCAAQRSMFHRCANEWMTSRCWPSTSWHGKSVRAARNAGLAQRQWNWSGAIRGLATYGSWKTPFVGSA